VVVVVLPVGVLAVGRPETVECDRVAMVWVRWVSRTSAVFCWEVMRSVLVGKKEGLDLVMLLWDTVGERDEQEKNKSGRTGDVITSADDDDPMISGDDKCIQRAWKRMLGVIKEDEWCGGSEVGEKDMAVGMVDEEISGLDIAMTEGMAMVEPVECRQHVDRPSSQLGLRHPSLCHAPALA
jgi:hypothetical protein